MAPRSTTPDEDVPLTASRLSSDHESQGTAHPSMVAVIAELKSLLESLRRGDRGNTEDSVPGDGGVEEGGNPGGGGGGGQAENGGEEEA